MPKQKPYRCTNPECSTDAAGRAIFDFWAEAPKCPKCGEGLPRVVPLEVVHYDPPSNHPGRGTHRLACTNKGYQGGVSVTGDKASVNCPDCRATFEPKPALVIEPEEMSNG